MTPCSPVAEAAVLNTAERAFESRQGDRLYLSMCSGCTAQYAVQGQPAGCGMQGDNGYVCPACQATQRPVVVIPLRQSYRLRDGYPRSARYVVLAPPVAGMCEVRRLGFPDAPSLSVHESELLP